MSTGTAGKSTARLFTLVRETDVSGTSGTGVVAEGVEWSNGRVTISWLSPIPTQESLDNIAAVDKIHGHDGRTRVVFKEPDVKYVKAIPE